jgi:hypothetical protein
MSKWKVVLIGAVLLGLLGFAGLVMVGREMRSDAARVAKSVTAERPTERHVTRASEFVFKCLMRESLTGCDDETIGEAVAVVLEATKDDDRVKIQCVRGERKTAWHRGFCDGRWGNPVTDDGLRNRMTIAW